MFPLSVFTYVKIGLFIVLVCGSFYSGWHTRDVDFSVYKDQVRIAAEKQIAENESIQKQQALINKGIQDEYDAKLSLLRQYYANGVRNNNGSDNMSGLSTAPKSTDVISAYNQLAGNCAQTTLMLVELQKWINEQVGIK